MTEEEVGEFIFEQVSKLSPIDLDIDALKQELNKDLASKGWEIKSFKIIGSGFSFNVKPCSSIPASIPPATSDIPDSAQQRGAKCRKCGDLNIYGVPNQSDGTHLCYGCRTS